MSVILYLTKLKSHHNKDPADIGEQSTPVQAGSEDLHWEAWCVQVYFVYNTNYAEMASSKQTEHELQVRKFI